MSIAAMADDRAQPTQADRPDLPGAFEQGTRCLLAAIVGSRTEQSGTERPERTPAAALAARTARQGRTEKHRVVATGPPLGRDGLPWSTAPGSRSSMSWVTRWRGPGWRGPGWRGPGRRVPGWRGPGRRGTGRRVPPGHVPVVVGHGREARLTTLRNSDLTGGRQRSVVRGVADACPVRSTDRAGGPEVSRTTLPYPSAAARPSTGCPRRCAATGAIPAWPPSPGSGSRGSGGRRRTPPSRRSPVRGHRRCPHPSLHPDRADR